MNACINVCVVVRVQLCECVWMCVSGFGHVHVFECTRECVCGCVCEGVCACECA